MDAHDLRMVEMMEYRLEKELAKGAHKTYSDFYAAAKQIGQNIKTAMTLD
jgi:hypothetical protein